MKPTLLVSLLCLLSLIALGQPAFRIDNLIKDGFFLDKGWKFHVGDNPVWAKPNFDDSRWDTLNPTAPFSKLPQLTQAELGWFRLHLRVDSSLLNQPLAIDVTPIGATEIYLNGKLVHMAGRVSKNPNIERTVAGDIRPIHFVLSQPTNTIAVRYSLTSSNIYIQDLSPFYLRLLRPESFIDILFHNGFPDAIKFSCIGGLVLMLSLIHLCFYYFYRQHKANLLFSIALLVLAISRLMFPLTGPIVLSVTWRTITSFVVSNFHITVFPILLLLAVYHYLQRPHQLFFWLLTISYALYWVAIIGGIRYYNQLAPIGFALAFVSFLNYLVVSYQAIIAYNRQAYFLFYGGLAFLTTAILFLSISALFPVNFADLTLEEQYGNSLIATLMMVLEGLLYITIPVSVSLALASDFAQTSFSLQRKLGEVNQLSQEKQQILATQNERLEQQVETRTAELKASQVQLIQKEKLASLGELTAGIAHEIQNPLNFVNNFSEVSVELIDELKDGPFRQLPEADKEYAEEILGDLTSNLQKIHRHGDRASSIVKGMLEHSRTESGEKRPTDLNSLADEYLKIAYHGLRAKDKSFNCELITEFEPTLEPVEVAPQEIGRVLLNLYNNAFYAVVQRQYLAEDSYQPMVQVQTKRLANYIEIRVSDNGTGIPDSVKAKIFQPFFTTKPTGEGTGLGLSLSYDIITKGHGGTLTVESAEGQGTTFVIQLPI
ncbi:histidine kinase [Spirosoma sp. HMF4905]|uniref:histidine kinase n=1 Tax=Spirosoma arboris TaxID=2682092 RepID=A0A7K1S5F7_9BACT|nr:ATP-binding protein [Spirosoma arboris]MVM29024.1 histidine kinase [Spirosoma arboris]